MSPYEKHTVAAALARGELSEDEAYFVLRFAGHVGYSQAITRLKGAPWWSRARRWLVWVGGWEQPELSQWDGGHKAWELRNAWNGKWANPTPVALFDHRVVVQGWGWQLRGRRGYWVYSHHGSGRDVPPRFYWSPNGTTWHKQARIWWQGKPGRA